MDMKRIVLILLLSVAVGASAQTVDTLPDTVHSGCGSARHYELNLGVGLAGGYTFYVEADHPYASTHGYTLQIPLLLRYDFSPHWRLSTGLRYDFNWDPLKHRLTYGSDAQGNEILTIDTAMHYGTQSAYIYHSYLGVPIELTWYPMARKHGALNLSLDIYAAYAISRYLRISEWVIDSYDPYAMGVAGQGDGIDYAGSSMLPWKLEVGFTVAFNALGLIHGVRFFGNLLPTYLEPTSGRKIYPCGMTVFL